MRIKLTFVHRYGEVGQIIESIECRVVLRLLDCDVRMTSAFCQWGGPKAQGATVDMNKCFVDEYALQSGLITC